MEKKGTLRRPFFSGKARIKPVCRVGTEVHLSFTAETRRSNPTALGGRPARFDQAGVFGKGAQYPLTLTPLGEG